MFKDGSKNPWPNGDDWFSPSGEDHTGGGGAEVVPAHCECPTCNSILEAPLVVGSPKCCVKALKNMLFDYVQRDYSQRGLVFDDSVADHWKGWCHLFVELCNTDPAKAYPELGELGELNMDSLIKAYAKIIDSMDPDDFD